MKKFALVLAAVAAVFALSACGNNATSSSAGSAAASQADKPASAQATSQANKSSAKQATSESAKAKTNTVTYQLDITAPDWNDDSTPVLIHIVAPNQPGTVWKDTYHAVTASEVAEHKATLDLQPGEYTIEVISPVNADGSVYNVPEPQQVVVADPNADKTDEATDNADKPAENTPLVITANLSKIDAKDVTELQLNTIYEYFDTARRNSDGTLEGDKGKAVEDKLWENRNAAPVMKNKAEAAEAEKRKYEASKSA